MNISNLNELEHVVASISYTEVSDPPTIKVFPKKFGKTERVPEKRESVSIYDCRPVVDDLHLDLEGFEFKTIPTNFQGFYDSNEVIQKYYPEVEKQMEKSLSAYKVIVFDHNVRSQIKAGAGLEGVREPVDGAHNDYTLSSGPRRVREILGEKDLSHLLSRRCALVNFWRPITGPIFDFPIAICDARTTRQSDFVPTKIEHYLEGNLRAPSLTGEIYSFRYSIKHRWFYVSAMIPDEVILLKCFDTGEEGQACFTGHTGFLNPNSPKGCIPRESIEARTIVVY
ncbi:MAG: CmcJ/NvfI family oxidoreductase [Pseudomonadota bacterium]|nr:CmcJ/NvfI family oxidoreductase [Pseudomonadota bacterium]